MKSALVVVDMVNDFVHDDGALTVGKPAQDIVPYISDQISLFRGRDDIVVGGVDWHSEFDCAIAGWPVHAATKWGREYYGVLSDIIPLHVYKSGYDCFKKTSLADYLRRHQVKQVHLCGVCTDICVFATAMGAYDAGFKTVIHARGCATFTQHHKLFLDHMKLCFKSEIVE
jgi:nicotinamidase-related amidase